jgi:lysophospholipase L1-like esterase
MTSAAGQTAAASSAGSVAGGSAAAGKSATGGAATGGSAAGGKSATGGATIGGSAAAGSETGGSAAAGSEAGGSVAGGSATGGGVAGGTTSSGGASSSGGAGTAGKTATGGSTGTTGGSAAAGKTATGGTTTGGTTGGGTGKITVWMSGDSTMSGSGCDGGGWGDQFGSLFNSNVTVQNKSVAGRSIQTWLYEKNVSSTMTNGECALTATTYSANWTAMLDASTGMKAGDWLLVEFGINDGDGTCPRHVGTTLFQTYLTTMAKAATDRGAHPIFLTSTSAVACNGSTAQANRGFGPQTKATGTADNVPVIDMTVLTAALYTSAGLCPNSNDYSSTTSKVGLFFCNDHTHFEAAGALQVAKTAAQALKDQNIPLASYLLN